MLPASSSSPSSPFYLFPLSSSPLLSSIVTFFSSSCFPQLCYHAWPLGLPFFSYHYFYLFPLPLCAPFPSTHQSLALASPLRTYGMMDRRASGASKAKGHLPGALRCRGALGPAMQPRPHTSVSRQSHTQHAHSNNYYRIDYLTLAPLTLIAPSHHV